MNRLLPLLLSCLLLQACALPKTLPEATDLKAGAAEVVVIGKVELVPPLNPQAEQKTHWNVIGEKRMLGRVLVATAGEFRPIRTAKLDTADFQETLEVEWGVPFMVKAARQRTYVNGALAHLDVLQQERLWFPGGYYFDVPKDANAVYIGTLRYYRNDFNRIVRVEIVDERKDIATVLKGGAPASEVRPSLLKMLR
jgi:hypothetical protein